MAKGIYKNRERTERRISAATSILLCALTVLAQIAVTLLLTHLLKEKASFVYGVLQFIGAVVAIRVYLRTGSPSYKLSWMCLLLALPVSGMILFCVWGGTHQAKQLSLKPVPPIPQRESQRIGAHLSRLLGLVNLSNTFSCHKLYFVQLRIAKVKPSRKVPLISTFISNNEFRIFYQCSSNSNSLLLTSG